MSSDDANADTGRFEVRMTADSHFGWIRTRLSVERTMMSWLRTSVSLIGFGFTIVQFFQRLNGTEGVLAARQPQAPRYLGLALIGAGVLMLFIAALQYRSIVRYLWSPPFGDLARKDANSKMAPIIRQSPIFAVAIAVFFIGIFAFAAVMFRLT